jgi:FAD/FMN-containing dehydrogenase
MNSFATTFEHALAEEDLRALFDGMCGEVFLPGSAGYEAARAIWNGRYDRYPALIVRADCATDVARAVLFARDHELPIAVRGGGHSLAGHSAIDGGLLIDLSAMKHLRVDPNTRTVRAEAGVLAGELNGAAQEHGLVVPVGTSSLVGIGGLTLGGGIGWLTRRRGLTLDSLLAAEMVTANGRIIMATEDTHPELFWGLRGGGGNFGVVTAFTYRAHPVAPEVLGGSLVYGIEKAPAVLRLLREQMRQAPEELMVFAVLMTAPPAAPFPAHLQGQPVLTLDLCYAGAPAEGERAIDALRSFGPPDLAAVQPMSYMARQSLHDAKIKPGGRHGAGSRFLRTLDDGAIDVLVAAIGRASSPMNALRIIPLGGAMGRVPADETAFPHRGAGYTVWTGISWGAGQPEEPHIAWQRGVLAALEPYASGAYVNVMGDKGEYAVRAAYGEATYRRLQALKQTYDPRNVFASNQNIVP